MRRPRAGAPDQSSLAAFLDICRSLYRALGRFPTLAIDVGPEASPDEISAAVDKVVFEPVGYLHPEETWRVTSYRRENGHLRIECRTARNLKGLILVPLDTAEG